jgi:hypothetical protein
VGGGRWRWAWPAGLLAWAWLLAWGWPGPGLLAWAGLAGRPGPNPHAPRDRRRRRRPPAARAPARRLVRNARALDIDLAAPFKAAEAAGKAGLAHEDVLLQLREVRPGLLLLLLLPPGGCSRGRGCLRAACAAAGCWRRPGGGLRVSWLRQPSSPSLHRPSAPLNPRPHPATPCAAPRWCRTPASSRWRTCA